MLRALGLVAAHAAQQCVGDVVNGPGVLDPVDERRIGPERAAHPDVDGLDDLLPHVGDIPPEADVGDLGLGARSRAARQVHADDPGVLPPSRLSWPADRRTAVGLVRQLASSHRAHVTARSLVSTTANLQNSLPVHDTTPRSKGPGIGRVLLEQRFTQQSVEPVCRGLR